MVSTQIASTEKVEAILLGRFLFTTKPLAEAHKTQTGRCPKIRQCVHPDGDGKIPDPGRTFLPRHRWSRCRLRKNGAPVSRARARYTEFVFCFHCLRKTLQSPVNQCSLCGGKRKELVRWISKVQDDRGLNRFPASTCRNMPCFVPRAAEGIGSKPPFLLPLMRFDFQWVIPARKRPASTCFRSESVDI